GERHSGRGMKTAVIKRSIMIGGRKTSISLEDEFWYGLLEIAAYKKMTVPTLVKRIDHRRKTVNLSSAIRIFVFNYFKGHDRKRKFNKRKLR
ncbi:MAG: ribbon-helix-helix domain-containing protein, partial [Pseudolabrys sp.]